MQIQSVNLEANKDKHRAAIYDAAMVLLRAQYAGITTISPATIADLSELCRKIELGEKILLDF